ncbi:Uncharacterized protein LOCC1_G006059 [Lachnellula occidentalis]|uniref:Uncharacterized protein n=1 Tax=Lachnellula occidentalis TaxID=215460 RepID=A0A8H8UA03_9HELO|nr:Uncharacterized protein LOCC1_G006059 [Lachnellula occidentalis]
MLLATINTVPSQAPITDTQAPFTLSIPPKTDIFVSPALGYHFSAPIIYTAIATDAFKSTRATISVPFRLPTSNPDSSGLNPTLQFDQAGLIFVLPDPSLPNPSRTHPGSHAEIDTGVHPKWIKAGIEVWEGKAWGSIVVRDKWSDWSLFELPASALGARSGVLGSKPSATITLEASRIGDALMIYVVEEGQEAKPVRKVPWWFMDGETEEAFWVGVYGARPDPFGETMRNLEVEFAGFEVQSNECKL